MSYAITTKSLAALLLAGAALAGCGGGDAEAPPPPVGSAPSGPDTTAPSLTIANDVPAATAAGPVTFTFVFSEDVGVSFDGTDIVVDGGSPGAFTRIDGRQATLVVTPDPGVAGTITVTVAAGRVTDIAGNANTAGATDSKAYIASQTITFASIASQTVGTAPPALSATASSGLPVTIASTTTSVCTVSGSTRFPAFFIRLQFFRCNAFVNPAQLFFLRIECGCTAQHGAIQPCAEAVFQLGNFFFQLRFAVGRCRVECFLQPTHHAGKCAEARLCGCRFTDRAPERLHEIVPCIAERIRCICESFGLRFCQPTGFAFQMLQYYRLRGSDIALFNKILDHLFLCRR